MALAQEMMAGGFSAGGAAAINGQVASAVTAAGTTISDATALTASINVVTTGATGAGVQLIDGEIGDEQEVLNLGTGTIVVYPPSSSDQVNALTAGAGFNLAPNTAVRCRKFTATRWVGYLSA